MTLALAGRSAGWSRWVWLRALARFRPRSLYTRAMLIMVTPLILVQVVATYAFFDQQWSTLSRRLFSGVTSEILVAARLLDSEDAAERRDRMAILARTLWMDLRFVEGARLGESDPPASTLALRLWVLLRAESGGSVQVEASYREEQVTLALELGAGVLHLAFPRKRLFTSVFYAFVPWMIGSSLIMVTIATLLLRNQLRAVRRLANAADALGKGRDIPDFRPEGAREVREAAAALLRMRQKLGRHVAQRQELLAGVSHDLRTPLTRMKLQLAMLDDPQAAADLHTDIAEMEQMIALYLAFARGDGDESPIPCALADVLRAVVAARPPDEARKITLEVAPLPPVPLKRQALKRCLDNVIANAAQYAKTIKITASASREQLEIIIDDDGPGVPPPERNHVLTAFYRLSHPARGAPPSMPPPRDSSNESGPSLQTGAERASKHQGAKHQGAKHQGVGLGLTISRDVMRGHGGDLILDTAPAPLGGLRVRLLLPV